MIAPTQLPRRGRPKKSKRLVPMIVLVPPEVKKRYVEAARDEGKTMSAYTREVLERW